MSIKIERINDMLIEKISYIIATEVKDKDVNFVTITDVNVSSDLSYAKVYFTTMGDKLKTTKALNRAKGFIRSQLFNQIDIRNIPELTFVYDKSIEYGERIDQKLNEIEAEHE